MTREEWEKYGFDKGWVSLMHCDTHDGIPISDEENDAFDQGEDPCIPILRLYVNREEKNDIEARICVSHKCQCGCE